MEEPEEVTFQFLREITDDFSKERKVGEGTFGTVYKGVTTNGNDVAVKIFKDRTSDLDDRQFRNEFYNLTKVKHKNIVRVLGYCYETKQTRIEYNGKTVLAEETQKALCFEFLGNGTLENHLFEESCGHEWDMRYNIIKGTCEGLKYLHKDRGESLLHLDLKPANILLDENMVPKIADFGLSKIFSDQLPRTTQSPLGTLGFQPVEFIHGGKISEKFDIFSLGGIIIRIVSGPDGHSKYVDAPAEFIDQVLRNWRKRWEKYSNGSLLEAWFRQVETCTQIALNCLEDDSQKRPDIVKIIDELSKIEAINNEVINLQAPKERNKTTEHSEMKPTKEYKETSFHVGEELIVGREGNKEKMASLLGSMSEKIIIFPVYGIGGIGKTTFARLIYNDTNFKYYSQAWVYVSPRFDLCKIGNSIISQLSGKENQANELHLIKNCLTKLIAGKNILIVLDDLWENNRVRLMDLKDMLNPGDSSKTVVLVTTRSEDIARTICSNIEPYKIEALTDEMCWDIIKQKSGFQARHDKEKLVGIGKEIARKCGGVALAAQTLGSILQSRKYAEWEKVMNSEIWNETFSRDASLPNHVLASLKLSYVHMDDCLKSCFTYCAIFPKGYKIVKRDLIHQWISLDFIKQTLLSSTMELCEKYIVNLLGMSFLQHAMSPTTYRAYGEHDTVFTMHDLVHDLATTLLGEEILDQSKQGYTGGSSCRFALLTDCSKPLESSTTSLAMLRALRFMDCRDCEVHGSAFCAANSLRVLDLSECFINKLPDSIGRMKQLRYINAPKIKDRMIPECITTLSKLRFLSLRGSCFILALPDSIGEIQDLVHLDLSGCSGIEELPESFGDLKSLEHLDFANCQDVIGVSQCLARFTKLQYLNLSNCENVGQLPKALGSLTELQYLNLSKSSYLLGNELDEAEFLGSLTKLKYLNLSAGKEVDIMRLPEALGSLTELKYLNLSRQYRLRKLPTSFGNLCNLVHLDLSRCYYLRDVSAALNGLTKLQYLDLYACSSLARGMEGLQEVFGNLSELRHLNFGNIYQSLLYPDEINVLLERICTLTNLEYLNLSQNDTMSSIPETLCNLKKLHTLDLSGCRSLRRLPVSISEMHSLKFVYRSGNLGWSTLPQYNTVDGECFVCEYDEADSLEIRRLQNVKSVEELQAMKLVEKTHIRSLSLEWTGAVSRFVEDAEVLRELVPPHSVSFFCLQGYNSISFPSWVMRIGAYLPGLTTMEMNNLPRCGSLPTLGQLPNLQNLRIIQMHRIKKIDVHLYGGSRAFPRLEKFTIDDMKCLEEWDTEDGLNEPPFPCLSSVEIKRCPRLRIKPHLPRSISKLRVHSSDKVMLSSRGNRGLFLSSLHVECCMVPLGHWSLLRHLRSLEHLEIAECSDITCCSTDFLQGLTSLTVRGKEKYLTGGGHENFLLPVLTLPNWLGDLTSLTKLKISDYKFVMVLPGTIQKLTHLQTLICTRMFSLPEWLGDLRSLTRLGLDQCWRIETLPDSIQLLTCLQTLEVKFCGSMVSLPEYLGDLTSLMELNIIYCSRIETLPVSIQQLTRLQTLELISCKSMVSLPETLGDLISLTTLRIIDCEGIKSLPVSIQQLTRLQTLCVSSCKGMVSLPETLGDLISLTSLWIDNCRGIKSLPGTIQKLTSLQHLMIDGCPELVQWCELEENKMKLAHIIDKDF
ncbi:putative disease resistance protein RGA4 isoform X2 [Panicum virgatum]|uniref:putative disease resistance protein RGA4 isoform X2 n=1 Tax=Panicum virgatum TaxID=38727 RepID=UPI0019D5D7A3|nr:putative disease resistance protein RGA4 isoform X2 [Panicum virgatum]